MVHVFVLTRVVQQRRNGVSAFFRVLFDTDCTVQAWTDLACQRPVIARRQLRSRFQQNLVRFRLRYHLDVVLLRHRSAVGIILKADILQTPVSQVLRNREIHRQQRVVHVDYATAQTQTSVLVVRHLDDVVRQVTQAFTTYSERYGILLAQSGL